MSFLFYLLIWCSVTWDMRKDNIYWTSIFDSKTWCWSQFRNIVQNSLFPFYSLRDCEFKNTFSVLTCWLCSVICCLFIWKLYPPRSLCVETLFMRILCCWSNLTTILLDILMKSLSLGRLAEYLSAFTLEGFFSDRTEILAQSIIYYHFSKTSKEPWLWGEKRCSKNMHA